MQEMGFGLPPRTSGETDLPWMGHLRLHPSPEIALA